MIIHDKELLFLSDIRKYEDLAENINFSRIKPHILSAQNEELRWILTEDLFDEILTRYAQTFAISSVTPGSITTIGVNSATGFVVGDWISINGLVGTILSKIPGSALVRISGVDTDANTISIDIDTTGLVWDSEGEVINLISNTNKLLRDQILPYLVFCVLIRFLPKSNQYQTGFGLREKTNQYSTPVDNQGIGLYIADLKNSREFWKRKLQEYLEENKGSFSNYKQSEADTSQDSGHSSIPIFSRQRNKLTKIKRRFV